MRIVYSTEFLLSVGCTDRCKKLPPGFDASLLSELQEVSAGVLERSKGHYTTSLGRSDGSGGYSYSSRGGSGSSGGMWIGVMETNTDAIGRIRGMMAYWEAGVSLDRQDIPGIWHRRIVGMLISRIGHLNATSHHVLTRFELACVFLSFSYRSTTFGMLVSEYITCQWLAAPFSRKDVDSMNDETFGSSECSHEDRAEEERKRRASFELMRKEQHKVLQEKKNGPDIEKENPGDDKSEKPDGSAVPSVYQEGTTKTSSVLPAPMVRPLVPPGFSNAFVEKKLQSQPSNISLEPKAHNATSEDNMPTISRFGGRVEGHQSATEIAAIKNKERNISDNIASVGQKHMLPSGGVTSSTEFASSILKGNENWEADAMDKYSIEKEGKSKNIDSVRKDNSISILEQFFGNALSKSGSNLPTYVESQEMKTDDNMMVSSVPESSKFARWFLDEDLKPAEDLSSKSLLSMIVKNEHPGRDQD